MSTKLHHAFLLSLPVLLVAFLLTCLERVDVGCVGVKVKLAGSDRGVQDMQLRTGWVVFNPLTEQVVEFPISVQNIILSASPHEGGTKEDEGKPGHAADESITFSSVEGVNANADVGFSFHIQPDLAPVLYARFRQNNMRDLAYGYMRNVIRENFNEVASKMPIQEIYGVGKTKMLADVNAKCKETLGKDGVIIDQLTINGALRLPENVAAAINNAMAATQNAIQSENKVRQIKAEAEAARQKAQGEADSVLIAAEADGKSKIIRATAEAKANQVLKDSLDEQVLKFKALAAWNGILPTYMGGNSIPMISVK